MLKLFSAGNIQKILLFISKRHKNNDRYFCFYKENTVKKIKIKRILCALIFFCSFNLFAHDIQKNSYFTILGTIDLREKPGFNQIVLYETLNHESGMKVKVLKIGERETVDDVDGVWLYILTTSPMWVSNQAWVEKYSKFWIFLSDDMPIFEYEQPAL